MTSPTIVVVAKAPVPGLAKTRIAATIGDQAAADLAASALLDTLVTVQAVGWPVVVAMTGDPEQAARADEIAAALDPFRIVPQRGDGLSERLAHAHQDARSDCGTVQVGMDTPQLTVADYLEAGSSVALGHRVIGPADDGGWWLLGLPDPAAAMALTGVEMSAADTGAQTERAMGGDFVHLRTVRDMDTWADAQQIARDIPISLLAHAVDQIGERDVESNRSGRKP